MIPKSVKTKDELVANDGRTSVLQKEQFLEETWPQLLGSKSREEGSAEKELEPIEKLFNEVVPSLDEYIERWNIPTKMNLNETRIDFLTRVNEYMHQLNERHQKEKGWKDCWPSTAVEIGRTNCALGSLVLGRTLEKAGIPREEIQYGWPGPLSHAVIITEGRYIDQANGVITEVKKAESVNGIETYIVEGLLDKKTAEKIPFRRIPVTSLEKGVAPLIWNLDIMLYQYNGEAEELAERFNVNRDFAYGNWGRDLLGESWTDKRLYKQPEWQQEKEDVNARFSED